MQNEIKEAVELLDNDGKIIKEGWARKPFWNYDRSKIKANAMRIKEWDYYSILSQDKRFGIALTISDLGYAGLIALCYLDFNKAYSCQVDSIKAFTFGKMGFPNDPEKDGFVSFSDKKLSVSFEYKNKVRTLKFEAPELVDADGNKGIKGEIVLNQPAEMESINIATSWAENRKAFYYNNKTNCLPASGSFTIGSKKFEYDPKKDCGQLDWGRGRWTYKNRWYWGSGSGYVDGESFGFNIGYGFSDRTPASENTIFYKGKNHKLEEVTFVIDKSDYTKPWKFTSSDGRFEMDFVPIIDRHSETKIGPIQSIQHQVFGEFSGTAILDDGKKIKLDKYLAFAEDVFNAW